MRMWAWLAAWAVVLAAAPPRAARAQGADAGAGAGTAAAAAAAPVDPDAPTIAARADKTEAHVGDRDSRQRRRGRQERDRPSICPGSLDLGPFSVLSREEGPVQNLGDGRTKREFTLSVAAYEPGEVELPAIEVTYLGARGDVKTVRTEPVAIKIASVIANEPEPALKEGDDAGVGARGEPPAALRRGRRAGGGARRADLVFHRPEATHASRRTPGPAAAARARDRAGAPGSTGGLGFIENADNRPFYFAVSEIIRDYLGGRYGFDSLEMTTDELGDELQRRAGRELLLERGRGLAGGAATWSSSPRCRQRRRGARHAGGRDPHRDHQPSGARAAGAAPGAGDGGAAMRYGFRGC